jgi:hypothetical protein
MAGKTTFAASLRPKNPEEEGENRLANVVLGQECKKGLAENKRREGGRSCERRGAGEKGMPNLVWALTHRQIHWGAGTNTPGPGPAVHANRAALVGLVILAGCSGLQAALHVVPLPL